MALVTTKRNVDVLPGQAAPTVFHCSQHDVGATIILGLVNAGSNFSIPSGVTAIIQGSCSNGAVFTPVTATVSGSDITFNLSAEMTSIAGPTVCEAVLSKDTDVLGTANFILDVEPSAMGSDTPPVFADAAWLWMVDKMGTETVSALDDKTVIDAINGKANQADITALSNGKLNKNQGAANAGKYLKVGTDGNVTTAELDVTTDKTLSIADKAADAKAIGDELDVLKADLNDIDDRVADLEAGGTGGLSKTAVNLLNTILGEAVYGTDQTANIELLYKELSNVKPVSITATLTSRALVGMRYSELTFEITATFDDESTSTVTDGYRVTTTGAVHSGSNTVTVSYRGVTTNVTFMAEQVVTHTITYNLTDVTSSNNTTVVVDASYYSTILSVPTDHGFNGCTVTMGGVDITGTAFRNMEILITEVTGDVVITASATKYQYMDDLIISGKNFNGKLYSDNLVTQVGTLGGGTGVVAVSEYPALRDCEITYIVSNNSGTSVNLNNLLGLGMIPSDNISNIHPYNKNINIPYWTKISNSSDVLDDGKSLTGTIRLKAGYQLAMTASSIEVYSALTVQLVGGYVADEFSEYEQMTFSGASSNYGKYRTISFYSDNGTTLIKAQASGTFKLISDSISAGTYDVYMAVRGAYDASNIGSNNVYVGAVADATSTQSNYAFGLDIYATPNMWYHEQITVTDDGMAVIGYGSYLSTGTIVDMRMKEVSA